MLASRSSGDATWRQEYFFLWAERFWRFAFCFFRSNSLSAARAGTGKRGKFSRGKSSGYLIITKWMQPCRIHAQGRLQTIVAGCHCGLHLIIWENTISIASWIRSAALLQGEEFAQPNSHERLWIKNYPALWMFGAHFPVIKLLMQIFATRSRRLTLCECLSCRLKFGFLSAPFPCPHAQILRLGYLLSKLQYCSGSNEGVIIFSWWTKKG